MCRRDRKNWKGRKGRNDEMCRSRRYSVDLLAHMAECDVNYARLMKLMPRMAEQDEHSLKLVMGGREAQVTLRVLERCRYTSLVELSQHPVLGELEFELPPPRLRIRLYHDARNAEVVEFQRAGRFRTVYPYPNPEMRHRDEKIQVNRFLGEYLSACLSHGTANEPTPLLASG